MKTSDFHFNLPPGQIARHPVEPRDHARLMVIDRKSGGIEHARFCELGQWIHPHDLLLLNNTRVIKARLRNPEEGTELLLLRQLTPTRWTAIGRPARHLKPGTRLTFPKIGTPPLFQVGILEKLEGGERLVEFDEPLDVQEAGMLPLPPYIEKARAEASEPLYQPQDDEDYQTVYAEKAGSVAAPTAGLHFTRELLDRFRHTSLTLDIGVGTFRPVQAERLEDHPMHTESYDIPVGLAEAVEATRRECPPLPSEALCGGGIGEVVRREPDRRGSPPGRLVAVGTTVCRVIESRPSLEPGPGGTDIFIYPPYEFQQTDALITNFHLPGSTLLMLVAALTGLELQREAYRLAVEEGYRFFSYGDAMLIL